MASATVSTRGRVTIPKEIRERLRIKAGARVEFRVDTDGKLEEDQAQPLNEAHELMKIFGAIVRKSEQ